MRSETAIANTKCPVLGNTLARLLMAKACFHGLMHVVLAVLRWRSQAVDSCYVLIVFKTKNHFQAVLINLLRHNLQCTFPKESFSLNKSWTFCDANQILHRTSPWICLFRSVGVLLLSFLGEEKDFSTKWSSEDNWVSTKRMKLLQEKPLLSEIVQVLQVGTGELCNSPSAETLLKPVESRPC